MEELTKLSAQLAKEKETKEKQTKESKQAPPSPPVLQFAEEVKRRRLHEKTADTSTATKTSAGGDGKRKGNEKNNEEKLAAKAAAPKAEAKAKASGSKPRSSKSLSKKDMLKAENFNPSELPFCLSWANFGKLQKFYSMTEAETTSILLAMVGPSAEGKSYWSKFRAPKKYFAEGMAGATEEDEEDSEDETRKVVAASRTGPTAAKPSQQVEVVEPSQPVEVAEDDNLHDGAPLDEEGWEEEQTDEDPEVPAGEEEEWPDLTPPPTTPPDAAP